MNPPPRIMKIKTKINKWDLIKPKSFCTEMKTINKMKRQSTEWMKIFANDATKKGLISKIHKLMQINIKKKKKPNQKLGRKAKQTFLQRRYTDGQKQTNKKTHEKMLNIANYQRNANQNHYEVPPYTTRMAIIKKSANNKCQRGMEKREPSRTVGGNVNQYNYGKLYEGSSKN